MIHMVPIFVILTLMSCIGIKVITERGRHATR